jgi:hypothetical protein
LRHDSRKLILAGWLACEPAATSIDFRDVGLTPDEAQVVAQAIRKLPKLVSINVLRNESMGKEGARAFGEVLADHGGGSLKSICGVAGGPSVTLEVPRRDMEWVDSLVYAAELECTHWSESIANEQNAGKKVAKLMRKARAESGWYPLLWAARDGNNALIEAMLERDPSKINMHEGDKHEAGYTPLMCAANKGHAQTVEMLLEKGASTGEVDNHKRTAAQLAELRGFQAIADLIHYVAEQQRSKSLVAVVNTQKLIRTAVGNFRSSLGHISFEKDTEKAAPAAAAIQRLARGRSSRKLKLEVEKQLEDAPAETVTALAKRALLTSSVAKKLKSAVVPASKLAKAAAEQGERRRNAAAAAAQTLAEVAQLAALAAAAVEADADSSDAFDDVHALMENAKSAIAEATGAQAKEDATEREAVPAAPEAAPVATPAPAPAPARGMTPRAKTSGNLETVTKAMSTSKTDLVAAGRGATPRRASTSGDLESVMKAKAATEIQRLVRGNTIRLSVKQDATAVAQAAAPAAAVVAPAAAAAVAPAATVSPVASESTAAPTMTAPAPATDAQA